jgi:hypothetical protein
MLSAEFESDQPETRAELLRYTGHEFPLDSERPKEGARGTTAEINQLSARVPSSQKALLYVVRASSTQRAKSTNKLIQKFPSLSKGRFSDIDPEERGALKRGVICSRVHLEWPW